MLTECDSPDSDSVRQLFKSCRRMRAMIDSVLDLGMGRVFVDTADDPTVAAIVYSPMVLMAGDCESADARGYLASIPQKVPVVLPDEDWERVFRRVHGSKTMAQKRTMFESRSLDAHHVRALKASLPEDFTLCELDESAITVMDKILTRSIEAFYGVARFVEEGIGYCVRHGERVVSVAHTAFPFVRDFEVQVSTLNRPEYQRQGLATVACAALIEYALDHKLVPHWDAANDASVNLALKLGYSNPSTWYLYSWRL
ncbi:MAG: GNAT family N-acetyltransferase [Candidatus Thorarchaeota archaeon]